MEFLLGSYQETLEWKDLALLYEGARHRFPVHAHLHHSDNNRTNLVCSEYMSKLSVYIASETASVYPFRAFDIYESTL